MKNTWIRPQTTVQQFAANEYVAACTKDSGTNYKFVCDAPGEYLHGFGGFKACDATHTAPTSGEYQNGKMCNGIGCDGGLLGFLHQYTRDVVVWVEPGNYHATTALNIDSWETTVS